MSTFFFSPSYWVFRHSCRGDHLGTWWAPCYPNFSIFLWLSPYAFCRAARVPGHIHFLHKIPIPKSKISVHFQHSWKIRLSPPALFESKLEDSSQTSVRWERCVQSAAPWTPQGLTGLFRVCSLRGCADRLILSTLCTRWAWDSRSTQHLPCEIWRCDCRTSFIALFGIGFIASPFLRGKCFCMWQRDKL